MAFKDFMQQQKDPSGSPLDTTGTTDEGTRPRTTFREFMESKQVAPTVEPEVAQEVASAPSPAPSEVPEGATPIGFTGEAPMGYLPQETTPTFETGMAMPSAQELTPEEQLQADKALAAQKLMYGQRDKPMFSVGDPEAQKRADESLKNFYRDIDLTDTQIEKLKDIARDEAIPTVATMAAGTMTGGLGFLGGLAVRTIAAGAGEAVEQVAKKEGVIKFSQNETPWETEGELYERVGIEAGLNLVGDVAASGIKKVWQSRDVIKKAIVGQLRPGAEKVVMKLKANDPRLKDVSLQAIFDSVPVNTGQAIIENSNATGNFAKRKAARSQQQIQSLFFGTNKDEIQGEAYEMLDKTLRQSLDAEEVTMEGLTTLTPDLVKGRVSRWEREVGTLTSREAQLRSRAEALGLKNYDQYLSMSDKELMEADIFKVLKKDDNKAEVLNNLRDTVKQLGDRKVALDDFKSHVELSNKRADAFDKKRAGEPLTPEEEEVLKEGVKDIAEKNIQASIEEILEKQNDMGRATTIHKALTDAHSYTSVIGDTYYNPIKKDMLTAEAEIGATIDLRGVRNAAIKRSAYVTELAQVNPKVDALRSMKEDMYTYEEAHLFVKGLKESRSKLFNEGSYDEAKFLKELIDSTETQMKDGMDTAQTMLRMMGKELETPDGTMYPQGALKRSYEQANELYAETLQDFDNKLIQDVLRVSELDEGAANQVMSTVLQSPNAMKVLTEYLNKGARRRIEEGAMGTTTTGEVYAALKGGAILQMFKRESVDGMDVYKVNKGAMEKYGEALDYLFEPKELENIKTWTNYFSSIEQARMSKTFQYAQKVKEYSAITGAIKLAVHGGAGALAGPSGLATTVGGAIALNKAAKIFYSDKTLKWLMDSQTLDMTDPIIWNNQKDALEGIVAGIMTRQLNDPDANPAPLEEPLKEDFPDVSPSGLKLADRLRKKYGMPSHSAPTLRELSTTQETDTAKSLRERLEAKYGTQ